MEHSIGSNSSSVLRSLVVRPIRAQERTAWDELMRHHHYLGLRSLPGKSLRYVATVDGRWLALIAWNSSAFKCAPRDHWIGWIPVIRLQRLDLIANNARFLILPGDHIPNLASRTLALNTKRLSDDWCSVYGHPIYLAETFVDSRYFKGTCYKAAGWNYLGCTSGFGKSHSRYYHHGHPKMVFVRPLYSQAREWLADPSLQPLSKRRSIAMELSHKDAENLMEMLRQLPDPRKARGIRHSHASVLAICVCAVLCGAQSYEAIAQWAQCRTQETLKRLHCRYDFKKREYCPPSEPTIRRYLKAVDAQALDLIVSQWFLSLADPDSPLAIDGKTIRGARSSNGRQLHLVSAFLHKEGAVVAQCQVEEKSNEIKAIRPLLDPIDIAGGTATLDALHAQHDTATYIV